MACAMGVRAAPDVSSHSCEGLACAMGVRGAIGVPSDELQSETLRQRLELETKDMKAEGVNVLDWDGNDIMNTEECIRIEVAMDSGAIAHVMRPDCVPAGVKVDETHARNFTAANGGAIKNYGKARVEMMDTLSKNRNECINNVAEVTRNLHSTGQVCDQGFECLHMKEGCAVIPEGTLSKFLKEADVVTKYPRRNKGLYIAEFMVKAPSAQGDAKEPGFARQGANV